MDWKECWNKRIVKSVRPDWEMGKSLVKSSENKMKSESKLPMEPVTAGSKVSLAYDSLRELLEAVALTYGYKVYNHECYTAFLKEVIRDSGKGDEFDEIRRERNKINYYGKEVSPEEARNLIGRVRSLKSSVSSLLKKQP